MLFSCWDKMYGKQKSHSLCNNTNIDCYQRLKILPLIHVILPLALSDISLYVFGLLQ